MSTAPSQFRAIVVGAGPVGLSAAHVLSRAGLDYIVLEARDTVTPEAGASLILYPATTRIYHQLGIFDRLMAAAHFIRLNSIVTPKGELHHRGTPGENFRRIHGQAPSVFHRKNLLELLYDTLSDADKKRIVTGQKVVAIESDDERGVTVRCADGTEHHGSIVIGADGVHSKTRGFMRDLALASSKAEVASSKTTAAAVNLEKPFTATYRCVWGTTPTPTGAAIFENNNCHAAGRSVMFVTSPERSWFFLYELLDAPTQDPKRYSDDEMAEVAERFRHMHITKDITVGQVWDARVVAGISDLDEGMLAHWSHGRIVLAGDAAHKVTPNIGWGYNSGLHDVVVLANMLRRVVVVERQGADPGAEVFGKLFREYQDGRKADLGLICKLSGFATRQAARPGSVAGFFYWVVETVGNAIPGFEYFMTRHVAGRFQRKSPVLDWVHVEEPFRAEVPWVHPLSAAAAAAAA